MKALKILRKPDLIYNKINYRTREPYLDCVYNKNKIDEVIKELEELNSRSCYNCSYYEFNKGFGIAVCCNQDNSQEHCSYAKMQIEEDFCCKKWESK